MYSDGFWAIVLERASWEAELADIRAYRQEMEEIQQADAAKIDMWTIVEEEDEIPF